MSHLLKVATLRKLKGEPFHERLALYKPSATSPSREPVSPGTVAAAAEERKTLVGDLGLLLPAIGARVEELINHPSDVGFEKVELRQTHTKKKRQQELQGIQLTYYYERSEFLTYDGAHKNRGSFTALVCPIFPRLAHFLPDQLPLQRKQFGSPKKKCCKSFSYLMIYGSNRHLRCKHNAQIQQHNQVR